MVSLYESGIYLISGTEIVPEVESGEVKALTGVEADKTAVREGTIVYSTLRAYNTSDNMEHLRLRFDSIASHDIAFVGIVQATKALGMEQFPAPYILTNRYSTLCIVGGTINEDDRMFGLSTAKKYGGVYVSPYITMIRRYVREMIAGCSRIILDSSNHTRCGALKVMAVGEGEGELVKQFLRDTYDVTYPGIMVVYLDGAPRPGTGPQDIALAIIGVVFKNGYVKSKVTEFVGPGVASMTTDYRNGVDVMTTEVTRLSSTWKTDEDTKKYLAMHNRAEDYEELSPADVAYYDGRVYAGLSMVKPMTALPFHPSSTYETDQLKVDITDIFRGVETETARVSGGKTEFTLLDRMVDGQPPIQQIVIAGCTGGTYSNIAEVVRALKGKNCGCDELSLAVYLSSQSVSTDLVKKEAVSNLMGAGTVIRTVFCGPYFGVEDMPCSNELSIRHAIRNSPNREGSKPGNGQVAAVALVDARSTAAIAANGDILISAWEMDYRGDVSEHEFDDISYKNRIYMEYGKGDMKKDLAYDPNIKDQPQMSLLADNILLKVCFKIMDPVTTTDELIPPDKASSYRSSPPGLTEFTLSRRDSECASRTKEVDRLEKARVKKGPGKELELKPKLGTIFQLINRTEGNEHVTIKGTEIGSMIYAVKPGGGSVRERMASCQRVIGGLANICKEYVTKRCHSNVMNWDMVSFRIEAGPGFEVGGYIYVPGIKVALDGDMGQVRAYVLGGKEKDASAEVLNLYVVDMTVEGWEVVKAGCLINYNRAKH